MTRSFATLLAGLALFASASAQKDDVRSITLERTACFGACPAYRITLNADGTAVYEGGRFAPRQGRYRGTFWAGDMTLLGPLLRKWGFWTMKPGYSSGATDQASQIVTVVSRAGKKTVLEYGNSGPAELWALQTMVDGLGANVKWTKTK